MGPTPSFDRRLLAAVFLGGFAGVLARAALAEALPPGSGSWPWATFVVNLAGAFALGLVAARPDGRGPRAAYRRPLLGAGFCGALTTFATLQLELVGMLDEARWGLAAGYLAASVAGGLLAIHAATCWAERGGRAA